MFKTIDFSQGDDSVLLPDGTPAQTVRVGVFICPSERNDTMRMKAAVAPATAATAASYPLNYGVNFGPWLIYDPTTNTGGPGSFYPNAQLKSASFTDGLSKTLMFSEVKAYTSYLSKPPNTTTPAIPTTPTAIATFGAGTSPKLGPNLQDNTGHVEWGDGRAQHVGFTTTFAPNTVVPYTDAAGNNYDIDLVSMSEGSSATVPTFASLTSRSYHVGLVNSAFMDGSVQTVANGVDLTLWRALSTRAGDEIIKNMNLQPAPGE